MQVVGTDINECLPGGVWSLSNMPNLPICAPSKCVGQIIMISKFSYSIHGRNQDFAKREEET